MTYYIVVNWTEVVSSNELNVQIFWGLSDLYKA